MLEPLDQHILKLVLPNKSECYFCRPEYISRRFKKTLSQFNANTISFNELFNTLMFLQIYEINNILIIKYFICIYNVITNGTFTFWYYDISATNFNKTFSFEANINDLCYYYTDDVFFQLEPHWPDIVIRPNLVCPNFILMCRCLNTYEINSIPIIIDDPNDYTIDLISDDETNDRE